LGVRFATSLDIREESIYGLLGVRPSNGIPTGVSATATGGVALAPERLVHLGTRLRPYARSLLFAFVGELKDASTVQSLAVTGWRFLTVAALAVVLAFDGCAVVAWF
jgi:hypothetical protein